MKETKLFFGMESPKGEVSESNFSQFVKLVSLRFPDGFSIWNANGQWLSPYRGLVSEKSKCLMIIHENDDPKIEELRSLYKTMFEQDSVLRIDTHVSVQF